jgi:hypothetical protein
MSQNAVAESFEPVLTRLAELTLEHMVAYRLAIGELILSEFFEGNAENFSDRSRFKATRFRDFLAACTERLADLGMSESNLRDSVRVHLMVEELDPDVRGRLPFSHLVALTRVPDAAHRRLLADAAVHNDWTVARLRAAAARIKAGDWIDQDPNTAGLQPEAPKPKAKPTERPTRAPTASAIRGARPQAREVKRVQTELKRTEKVLGTVMVGLRALKAGGWEGGEKREELRAMIAELRRRLEELGDGV